ncbi:hypothetical protein MMC16_002947 [Acarospora aff. strigata]|nr:hypothetical protein [Acarospora aff. strigata]
MTPLEIPHARRHSALYKALKPAFKLNVRDLVLEEPGIICKGNGVGREQAQIAEAWVHEEGYLYRLDKDDLLIQGFDTQAAPEAQRRVTKEGVHASESSRTVAKGGALAASTAKGGNGKGGTSRNTTTKSTASDQATYPSTTSTFQIAITRAPVRAKVDDKDDDDGYDDEDDDEDDEDGDNANDDDDQNNASYGIQSYRVFCEGSLLEWPGHSLSFGNFRHSKE